MTQITYVCGCVEDEDACIFECCERHDNLISATETYFDNLPQEFLLQGLEDEKLKCQYRPCHSHEELNDD